MGEKNITEITCMKDKERFADLCNAKLYEGREVIKKEELELLDSSQALVLVGKDGTRKGIGRFQDVVMRWKREVYFIIIPLELQSNVHYAMAVRKMLYDGMGYVQQIGELFCERNEKEYLKEEYLSRFRKEDSLLPIIPIVFSLDLNGWDASTDIHGLINWERYGEEVGRLKKLVPNYHFNLVDICDNSYIDKLKTDLHHIFHMVEYKNNKKGLQEYTREHAPYLPRDTYIMAATVFGLPKKLTKELVEGGKVNVCKAIEDIREEGREEIHMYWSRLIQAMEENGEESMVVRLAKEPQFFREKLAQYHIE